LRDAVRRKRREKQQGQWFLHPDSAPNHTSVVWQQYMDETNISFITQPPHSPDLALSGFWLSVPYSENGPQGEMFRSHGGHQTECDGRNPKDTESSLPPVIPTAE
jgi:hypothetical protein